MDIHEPSLKSIGIQFCRVMILRLAIYSVTNFTLVLQGGFTTAGTTFSGRVLLRGGGYFSEGRGILLGCLSGEFISQRFYRSALWMGHISGRVL